MIKGKLDNGFEFEIDETRFDDMEFVDDLADAADNDPLAVSRVSRRLLGEEQRKKLYDTLRAEDGRVPIADAVNAIKAIMEQTGENTKN